MARTEHQLAAQIDRHLDRQVNALGFDFDRDECGRPTVDCIDCGGTYAYEGEEADHGRCESCFAFEGGVMDVRGGSIDVMADAASKQVVIWVSLAGGNLTPLTLTVGEAQEMRDILDEAAVVADKAVV